MSSSPSVPMQQASPDIAEIEAIVRDYIEGWCTGDVKRMDGSHVSTWLIA
ncbi:hypothetical protein BH23ACT4_BH23ACT4_10600 [soil metagenome]